MWSCRYHNSVLRVVVHRRRTQEDGVCWNLAVIQAVPRSWIIWLWTMCQVNVIVADCTYRFLSCCGYAEGQWGILETGSRTPDLKGGLHTCPSLRVDISIVSLIATRERAWWNFLYVYCSVCSRAVLRCTPSPLFRLLPKNNVWLKLRSFYCRLRIAFPFYFLCNIPT